MRCLFLLFFISSSLFSQEFKSDYFDYHNQINKAENFYFIEKNVDSALFYYNKTFKEFDFIFVRDILTSIQIAIFENKPFDQYIFLGFSNGLKIEHLKSIPLVEKYYFKNKTNKKVIDLFKTNRDKYLKRINVDYLDFIYNLSINDQIDKHKEWKIYKEKIKYSITLIEKKIIQYGFPGEKLLGISDSTIFKDLNSNKLDFYARVKKMDRFNKVIGYFNLDEAEMCLKLPYLIFVHQFDSYSRYSDYWVTEIKKGNVHPRVVGMLHDNTYRCSSCSTKKLKGYFGNNIFTNYHDSLWDVEKINKNRKSLYINSLEVDLMKKEYETKHNFIFSYGLFHHR